MLDNEEDEDDQVEQLGYDIRSMIKTGVEKDEENASLASNVDDLIDQTVRLSSPALSEINLRFSRRKRRDCVVM